MQRAVHWQRMLEPGRFSTINEMAAAEKFNPSYVSCVLLLALLTPDIVEAILDGRQPERVGLALLLRTFPVDWHQQRASLPAATLPIAG